MKEEGRLCEQNNLQDYQTSLSELQEQLRVLKKRYEIAVEFSDVAVFDYDLNTHVMTMHQTDCITFGFERVIKDAVDFLVRSGVIARQSVQNFLDMYKRIYDGADNSEAKVWVHDQQGRERLLEMRLATIYDRNGKPIRALGMHRDVTDKITLQKEQQYSSSLTSELSFVYEANITTDTVLNANMNWLSKIGFVNKPSFTVLIERMSEMLVAPEYRENFRNSFSRPAIITAYDSDKRSISIEFLQNVAEHEDASWYQQNVNIICDEVSGDYMIRCYMNDITLQKQKEQRALLDKRYYEAMLAKSTIVYEVNLTQNVTVAGYESLQKGLAVDIENDYSKIIALFSKKAVHPEDQMNFFNVFYHKNLIRDFYEGKNENVCDYRLQDRHGVWRWVRCTMYLFSDPVSKDICSFSYVEKIDVEKKRELDLIYRSQYDMLSGFYNKQTLKEKVDEYLESFDGRDGRHAFFIVDIDYFKAINDNFGHSFGDVVISEVAVKIRSVFREFDIFGRIGGDEFVVFMKNAPDESLVRKKAQKICDMLRESYSRQGVEHVISASVGIAYYSLHGNNYYELYNNSDAALYEAKDSGRDRFVIYNEQSTKEVTRKVKPIETIYMSRGRRFEDNVSGYVFRILYDAPDYKQAINSVLELLGKHYNVGRTYIFEESADGKYMSNTFEWCNKGIEPQIDKLQHLSYEELGSYKTQFNEEGFFYLEDVDKVENDELRVLLQSQGIKSMLQIAWTKNHKFVGFIGFDDCEHSLALTPDQLWDYRNVASMLGIFVMEMRVTERQEELRNRSLSLFNSLDSYAYVCDPDSYEVLTVNRKVQGIVPNTRIGNSCYREFMNREEPCVGCPMRVLVDNNYDSYSCEMLNPMLGLWLKVSVTWVDWLLNQRVCMVNCVDITKYKP